MTKIIDNMYIFIVVHVYCDIFCRILKIKQKINHNHIIMLSFFLPFFISIYFLNNLFLNSKKICTNYSAIKVLKVSNIFFNFNFIYAYKIKNKILNPY